MKTLIHFILLSFSITTTYNLLLAQDEFLETHGAITIGNSSNAMPKAGTIVWDGTYFKGWDGMDWIIFHPNPTPDGTTLKVADVDGHQYDAVKIGDQYWMTENLRTTKYNDGSDIAADSTDAAWSSNTNGAWCWFNNDPSNEEPYGKMYNWHAIDTDILCPTGWHVPSRTEWTTLINYLGGFSTAGNKLKEYGDQNWTGGPSVTNESLFTALPGGWRNQSGSFFNLASTGYFWTSTANGSVNAWYVFMGWQNGTVTEDDFRKSLGFSIRCIKN